ncbi:MAG TPA: hypothetical protein VGF95_14590 [Solirubrobacteraceae bacterium]|jgi:hypothetical protein
MGLTVKIEGVNDHETLARFARGEEVGDEAIDILEALGWVRSIPAVTSAGRAVLEEDRTVPWSWRK